MNRGLAIAVALAMLMASHAAAGVQFLGLDGETQGDWCSMSNICAYILPCASPPIPEIEYPIVGGGAAATDMIGGPDIDKVQYQVFTNYWYGDPRALEDEQQTLRRPTTLFSTVPGGSATVDVLGLAQGDYRVSAYLVDFDEMDRIAIVQARLGVYEASTLVESFHGGVYVTFRAHVNGPSEVLSISVLDLGLSNAVMSGIFIDPGTWGQEGLVFDNSDFTTHGDWVGNYGALYYLLLGFKLQPDIPRLPPSLWETPGFTVIDPRDAAGGPLFVPDAPLVQYDTFGGRYSWTVARGQDIGNAATWIWASPGDGIEDPYTDDRRAMTVPNCLDRIPAAWDDLSEDAPDEDIDLRLRMRADIAAYTIHLYFLDFDNSGRSNIVRIMDPQQQMIWAEVRVPFAFTGVYASFRIEDVPEFVVVADHLSGLNAVISGVILTDCELAPTVTPTPPPTATLPPTVPPVPTDTPPPVWTPEPSPTPTPTPAGSSMPTLPPIQTATPTPPAATPTPPPTMPPFPSLTPTQPEIEYTPVPTTPPDCAYITMYPHEIEFNPPSALPGEPVVISVPVYNEGWVNVLYVEIYFAYETTPADPKDDPNPKLIGDPVVLKNIPPGGRRTAATYWNTDDLDSVIYPVYVAAANAIPELCEPVYGQTDISLPVELLSFEALGSDGRVELRWATATEVNNAGFMVYRSNAFDSGFEAITDSLIPGAGTSFTRPV